VDGLAAVLRQQLISGSQQTIVIKADRSVTLETTVRVIDRIKAAGGERFLIATVKDCSDERSDSRIGWTSSLAFHCLLLLIFLFWKLKIAPFILDFTPMTFAPLAVVQQSGESALSALSAGAPIVELPAATHAG